MAEWYEDPAGLTSGLARLAAGLLLLAGGPGSVQAQVDSGSFEIRPFQFADGQQLGELRLHYVTLGDSSRPAVLILHGTGGSHHQFLTPMFAGELFGAGQPLDTARYFIVLADGIGHGQSSKPSDGLHARFPHYTYDDMVRAQYRLVTERLRLRHLRLILGTSMGCMHAWMWAETYPSFMDGIVPLACLPTQIAGRNRMWRKLAIDAIRHDPGWQGGDYTSEPPGLATVQALVLMVSGNPRYYQRLGPNRDSADAYLEAFYRRMRSGGFGDANDALYALEASRDYDPSARLDRITTRVLAINFADDQINPPELGIMERLISRVRGARYVLVPASDRTVGHGTHTKAEVWKGYLGEFLQELRRAPRLREAADTGRKDACDARGLRTQAGGSLGEPAVAGSTPDWPMAFTRCSSANRSSFSMGRLTNRSIRRLISSNASAKARRFSSSVPITAAGSSMPQWATTG